MEEILGLGFWLTLTLTLTRALTLNDRVSNPLGKQEGNLVDASLFPTGQQECEGWSRWGREVNGGRDVWSGHRWFLLIRGVPRKAHPPATEPVWTLYSGRLVEGTGSWVKDGAGSGMEPVGERQQPPRNAGERRVRIFEECCQCITNSC